MVFPEFIFGQRTDSRQTPQESVLLFFTAAYAACLDADNKKLSRLMQNE